MFSRVHKSEPRRVDADESARGHFSSRELVLAGLAVASAAGASGYVDPGPTGAFGAVLAMMMFAIAIADWRCLIIPDALNLAASALAFVYLAWENFGGDFVGATVDAAIRATAMASVFLAFRLVYRWARGRDGMGLGDVKLAGVAGLWLQSDSLPLVVEIAALAGLAFALVHRWRSGARLDPLAKLPFGAFLAPAIWLCWLFERWRA
jgi:leader peptidase (prepilin peptidase)/N-methyltransferase